MILAEEQELLGRDELEIFGLNQKRLVTPNLPMLRLSVVEPTGG